MKKIITACLLLICIVASAQKNPQQGFIITNANDTVYGMIDYLSVEKNNRQCLFCKDGETQYVSYSPNELQGYCLGEGDIYYVQRTFNVNGTEKTIFAEFLLKGGVSIYRYIEDNQEYFFLEDETGRLATVYDYKNLSNTDDEDAKRKALSGAWDIFYKSEDIRRKLWTSSITAGQLISLTREYNEKYCTESGECIEYQRNSRKASAVKPHFHVEGGVAFAKLNYRDASDNITMPRFGIGADWNFPRLSANFSLQSMLVFSFGSGNVVTTTDSGKRQVDISAFHLSVQIGGLWHFTKDSKVRPFVRGGLTLYELLSCDNKKESNEETENITEPQFGLYLGIGTDIKVGKSRVRLGVNYENPVLHDDSFESLTPGISISLGWLL